MQNFWAESVFVLDLLSIFYLLFTILNLSAIEVMLRKLMFSF